MDLAIEGRTLVDGCAGGELLCSDVGLSFWGGVDPLTGIVIDRHHPLHGECVSGRVLAIPSGRGSCTGSGVLLELILGGRAPAAIVVCEREEILTLGTLVAEVVFGRSLPVLRVERDEFRRLDAFRHAGVEGSTLRLSPGPAAGGGSLDASRSGFDAVRLTDHDRAFLEGRHGRAAQVAMQLLVRMAALEEAEELVDVTQVHVDGCIYIGPSSLRFAEMLVEWGARVRVPTTLNAISVDRRRWRQLGVDEALGVPASALADAYLAMGAQPSFTCAPYLLDGAPGFGEQVGWAESNAVVYANSVIGARTMKYPDFLDICIALTGRAPLAGCHADAGRQATLALDVVLPEGADDAYWPLLGYCCGLAAGSEIPLIRGVAAGRPDSDALKAFGAAFATTAAAPMFHIAGVTPEADRQAPERRQGIGLAELRAGWAELNSAESGAVGLVSLGNPHFSPEECAKLAALVAGRTRSPEVEVVVTCGRAVHEAAARAGHVAEAEAFGVRFVNDTCWCMLGEPVVPPGVRVIMTNSGKYAHYGPGLVGRGMRFGSLADCVEAACTGQAAAGLPAWL